MATHRRLLGLHMAWTSPLRMVRPMLKITHRHPLPCSCKTSSATTVSERGIGPVLSGHPEPSRLGIASNTACSHCNDADPSIEDGPPRWRSDADTLRRVHHELHRRLRYPHEVSGQSSQDSPDRTDVGSRQLRARIGTVLASRSSTPYGGVQAQTPAALLFRDFIGLYVVHTRYRTCLTTVWTPQARDSVGAR